MMQKMMGLVRKCIEDYDMIQPGDRVAVDDPIVVQAGSGMVDEDDAINFVDPFDENESAGEVDEFEEVKAPPTAAE
mgnify:CR=1 FL=1